MPNYAVLARRISKIIVFYARVILILHIKEHDENSIDERQITTVNVSIKYPRQKGNDNSTR